MKNLFFIFTSSSKFQCPPQEGDGKFIEESACAHRTSVTINNLRYLVIYQQSAESMLQALIYCYSCIGLHICAEYVYVRFTYSINLVYLNVA